MLAIKANYGILKKQMKGKECAAVVKANAYGLGIKPVAEALWAEGCKKFFVALMEEGAQLRQVLPDAEIFVLHGINDAEERAHFEHFNLTPVLNNRGQLEIWPKDRAAAVHFDTGMTRLGFKKSEAGLLMQNKIKLVMSHLSCAELPKSPYNYNQLIEFNEICELFPSFPKSLANSYGIFLADEFHHNLGRPGIALYGGNPTPYAATNPMQSVVNLRSKIIQVNHVTEKRGVGYGASYTARPGDIFATIPCGYADGLLRTLSNRSKVYAAGHALDVVGRVSMDLITVKINNLPESLQKNGTEVDIIGNEYTICDMARDAGTIEYEVLTRLGNRFKRVYE